MPTPRPRVSEIARHLPLRPSACAVLASLADASRPGIDILDAVNATVTTHALLGPGTLYRLLRELRLAGLIARDDGSASGDERQVHHKLTPLGRQVLQAEVERLERTISMARRAVAGNR
jgi:DNA-binding PadR family transcriptional regulator